MRGETFMREATIYRCNSKCPIGKKCFIIKTAEPIKEKITVLHKCIASKADIRLIIGKDDPP